jgi:hypothetical protein
MLSFFSSESSEYSFIKNSNIRLGAVAQPIMPGMVGGLRSEVGPRQKAEAPIQKITKAS